MVDVVDMMSVLEAGTGAGSGWSGCVFCCIRAVRCWARRVCYSVVDVEAGAGARANVFLVVNVETGAVAGAG